MSEKRWPLNQARDVALVIAQQLRPFCNRIEIAGSIRRGKPTVGDIEILYWPRSEERKKEGDMFATETRLPVDEVIQGMLNRTELSMRPSVTGGFSWGKLNKLAIHRSGIPVDLFCEPNPEDFARSLVIRTGPKELNIRLIQLCADRGIKMHAYGPGFTRDDGSVIQCLTEREVFALSGLPYQTPEERGKA